MLKILTLSDKILLLLISVTTVSSFFLIAAILPEGSVVIVEVDGVVTYKTDLSHESQFSVRGTHGELQVEVLGGGVRVLRADCPNKVCVRTGSRHRSGDIIVCVPNRTIVRIGTNKSDRIDAVTG